MQQLPTIHVPDTSTITVDSPQTLEQATSTLSQLNTYLDQLTTEKEKVTKPLNEAIKAERARFKPLEEQLANAIQSIRQSITVYATNQAKIALQQEQKILDDKRTKLETKVQQLAELEQPTAKVTTDQGSISFVTVRKYRVTDKNLIPHYFLEVNDTLVKQAMKEGRQIQGIEYYEEQSLRNYR